MRRLSAAALCLLLVFTATVTACGGVSSIEDLVKLRVLGVFFGAIVGRAIYTGEVDLAEALARIEER